MIYAKGTLVQVKNYPPVRVTNARIRGNRLEYQLEGYRQWIPSYHIRKASALAMNPLMPQEIQMLRDEDVLGPIARNNPCTMGYDMPAISNPEKNGLHLSEGNSKIGRMWNFNLQPGRPNENGGSCPGATAWCRKFCYASKGQSRMQWWRWKHNQDQTAKADFGNRMNDTLNQLGGAKLMRVHVGGDMYSAKYVADWINLAQAHKDWTFYSYTRSWRPEADQYSPGIHKALNYLQSSKVPNFHIRASTDEDTGHPGKYIPMRSKKYPGGWLEAGVGRTYTSDRPVLCQNLNDTLTRQRAVKAHAPGWHLEVLDMLHNNVPGSVIARKFFPNLAHFGAGKQAQIMINKVSDKYSRKCKDCKACWKLNQPLYFKIH